MLFLNTYLRTYTHTDTYAYVKLFNNSLFSFKSETSQNIQEIGIRLDFNFINTKKYSTPLTS